MIIWKLIAKTTRLSNNITVLCKENIEEIAVEKSIFPADILVRVRLFPANLKNITSMNTIPEREKEQLCYRVISENLVKFDKQIAENIKILLSVCE